MDDNNTKKGSDFDSQLNKPASSEYVHLYDEAIVGKVFELFYGSSDVVNAIDTTLALMGEYYDISRVYIFEDCDGGKAFSNTFEWCATGVEPQQDFLSNVVYEDIGGRELYYSNFDDRYTFYCPDINVLPAEQRAILAPQGIFAMLQCAILDNGEICGMIGFDECRTNRHWTDKQVGTLMFVSRIVALFLTKLRQSDGMIFSNDFRAALDYNAAYVYLINPDTYEIAYTNKAIQDEFHSDYISKICYREFIGNDSPCQDCPAISVKKTGRPSSSEIWRNDGRLMLSQASPLRWNGQDLIMLSCLDITERRKAEHALIAEKKKTELAMSATNISLWTYDFEANTITVSKGTNTLFARSFVVDGGYETVIKRGHVLPESQKAYIELHEKIRGGAAKASAVIHFNKELFHMEWLKITYTALENADGTCTSAIAIGEDITEQIVAQQRYRREEEYRKTLETGCLLSARLNVTRNRVEYIRGGAGVIEKIKPDSVLDDAVRICAQLIPDEAERKELCRLFERKNLKKAFDSGNVTAGMQFCAVLPGGRRRYLEVEVRLAERPINSEITAFAAVRDRTDEALIGIVMDKIVETGYDYIAYVNALTGYYKLFSAHSDSVSAPGGEDYDSVSLSMVEKYAEPDDMERVITETRLSYVLAQLRNNNEYVCVYRSRESKGRRTRQIVFRAVGEDKTQLIVTRQDVTELVEEARKNNERLAQALRSAEKANEAKSDFLSRMSHDIRTPLNAVIGLTALALDEPELSGIVRDYLNKIEGSGKLLQGLINDILDMSRIESGSMVIHPEHYDYEEFAGMLEATFGPTCKQKNLSFTIEGEVSNGGILADKVKMNQVFLNIISNAVKYTPEGGSVAVEIVPSPVRNSILPCDFYVKDSGIGMSEEFQRHMFEPFSQEQQSFSAGVEGTGLGLSIAKKLVGLMGGTLDIKSKLGGGTHVHVHLDLLIDGTDSDDDERAKRAADIEEQLKNKHILLAEDNEINSQIATKVLESKGMRVTCVFNGEEAVRAFSESEPDSVDAVLMDIRMPILDGLEATKMIRSLSREDAKRVPIIAMTANAFDEDKRLSEEAGMNAHLDKPIEPQEIFRTLAKLI